MDWAPVTGFVGVLAGGLLSFFTVRHQQSTARQERLQDQRIELYSEWITAMKRLVFGTTPSEQPLDILRTKLLLLEPNEHLRRLISKVVDNVPSEHTQDGQAFYETLQVDPDPFWKPFDDAVAELLDGVRASLSR